MRASEVCPNITRRPVRTLEEPQRRDTLCSIGRDTGLTTERRRCGYANKR